MSSSVAWSLFEVQARCYARWWYKLVGTKGIFNFIQAFAGLDELSLGYVMMFREWELLLAPKARKRWKQIASCLAGIRIAEVFRR